MNNIHIKTPLEIEAMTEGGRKLSRVKNALKDAVKAGVSAMEIEELANKLIKEEGASPSFKMVPGYRWATCVNVNEGLVHGIPKKEKIFKDGDVVSVDVGLFFKGFHTDTSFSLGINIDSKVERFLEVGRAALKKSIAEAKAGKYIYDISKVMEAEILKAGFSPVRALVGHGVGRDLHEAPQIPCFLPGKVSESPKIVNGMVLAIEVMYAQGEPEVEILTDGWTIGMRDGKISALFEETVAIVDGGPKVLTR